MRRDPRNLIVAALAATNALTLVLVLLAPRAAAVPSLSDIGNLVGIIDLERRLKQDAVSLVSDAVILRQRAVQLKSELDQTYQRLQITDADLARLNRDLGELARYRDIVRRLTGR